MKLSSVSSGWFSGGSFSKTSRAAVATCLLTRASYSAFSSMMPPRAAHTITTPFFIWAMTSALMSPLVSGVSGEWMVMKSDFLYRVGRSTCSTPSWAAFSGERKGSKATTFMNRPLATRATWLPIWPRPMMPGMVGKSTRTRHPEVAEERLQDYFSVPPGWDSVVDQQGGDDARCSGVPILDVFSDLSSPLPVAI